MRLERVVDVYLRHVTVERGLSAHTTAAYRRDLRDYLAWLAGEGIDDIEAVTQAATNGYLAARAADEPAPAASTLARVQSSIRGLHRFAKNLPVGVQVAGHRGCVDVETCEAAGDVGNREQ